MQLVLTTPTVIRGEAGEVFRQRQVMAAEEKAQLKALAIQDNLGDLRKPWVIPDIYYGIFGGRLVCIPRPLYLIIHLVLCQG
jgi:hypothetical protein